MPFRRIASFNYGLMSSNDWIISSGDFLMKNGPRNTLRCLLIVSKYQMSHRISKSDLSKRNLRAFSLMPFKNPFLLIWVHFTRPNKIRELSINKPLMVNLSGTTLNHKYVNEPIMMSLQAYSIAFACGSTIINFNGRINWANQCDIWP